MEKDTENKILKAAEEEFMAKGFAGTRTTVIAEKAGVTHAMLHYYFRTKEKLFERIINEKIRMISNIVFRSLAMTDCSIDKMIKTIVESHFDFLSENPDLPRFLLGELYSGSERAEMLKAGISRVAPLVVDRFQALIDLSAEKGKCKRVDAKQLLLNIISLNVFPFMAAPIVNTILGNGDVSTKEFIEKKKQENISIISIYLQS